MRVNMTDHDQVGHGFLPWRMRREGVKIRGQSPSRRSLMKSALKRKSPSLRSLPAPVDMPGLDKHLCFALYAASNHMTRMFGPFLQKLGVTYPQYLVLVVLWERGAQGVGDLAALLRMDLGT